MPVSCPLHPWAKRWTSCRSGWSPAWPFSRERPGGVTYNPLGTVHGGWFAALLDSAVGCAVHSTLSAGQGYTTLELKVNLVRALTEAVPRVRAEGKVFHVGRQVGTAEGRIVGPDGKHVRPCDHDSHDLRGCLQGGDTRRLTDRGGARSKVLRATHRPVASTGRRLLGPQMAGCRRSRTAASEN